MTVGSYEPLGGPPVKGGFQKYYGKYRGIVVQVSEQNSTDPDDRQQRGRIRVHVPAVYGKNVLSPWALPCFPLGSGRSLEPSRKNDQHGVFFVPMPGDLVWVEFEQGDPKRPIWTGAFYPVKADGVPGIPDLARGQGGDGTQIVPELAKGYTFIVGPLGDQAGSIPSASITGSTDGYASIYPFNRVYKSPSGTTVEFDDTDGAVRVRVRHPSGSQFQMRPDGSIRIYSPNEITVLSKGKMVLRSPDMEIGAGDRLAGPLTKLTHPRDTLTGRELSGAVTVRVNT
jgi:hypothetical protein